MNGADHGGAGLREKVHAAIAAGDLEDTVRAVLEARFPPEGPGAGLDEAAAMLRMSPALVAYIEFAALCAIAAGRPHTGAAIHTTGGADTPARPHPERGRA